MDKKQTILFTGGGTGGHSMPLIAIIEKLKSMLPESQIHYAGPKDPVTFEALAAQRVAIHTIAAGKIRRYFSLNNIVDIVFKIPWSFVQSFFIVAFTKPDLVFSKGGTGSLPIVFWAHVFGLPIFLHESDCVPGSSNKIAMPWAKKVFVSFKNTAAVSKEKTIVVGNPIRADLLLGTGQAKKELGISSQKPVILVIGGSQGAKPLNDFILLILNRLLENYEIIHVAGKNNYRQVLKESSILMQGDAKESYHLYEFLNQVQLKNAYTAADLIVSRAGAGSIFEIAAFEKPSILIPLPSSANNHQLKNAYEYAYAGGCIVIEEQNLSPDFFLGEIQGLLSNNTAMTKAAHEFAKPHAAEDIAKEIIKFLHHET